MILRRSSGGLAAQFELQNELGNAAQRALAADIDKPLTHG